jgi:ElaB/YqjD/DUF883 family membrane-anchored ribosome-binding protein
MKHTNNEAKTPSDLLDDLRSLVSEAEKMMTDSVVAPTEEAVNTLRERFKSTQARLADIYADTKRHVSAGAHYTDETIRAHPYPALAVAVGVGALLGVLVGRRCNR